jgi:nicotinic acid mononucleotide adenylyltransferase
MASPHVLHVPVVADLVPFRRALAGLDPTGPPAAVQVCGPSVRAARRLVAVAGSFNPPHVAHFALLDAGIADCDAGAGAFVLSVRTVDKERPTGMLLEDRLWLLCHDLAAAAGTAGAPRGCVATNRGLYVEQAAALRALCPPLDDLVFVVGYDKIVQIFDPRYYVDRERALDALFAAARFLVAPRDSSTNRDLAALLDVPENRRYAARVTPLAIDAALASVSSSAVRDAAPGTGASWVSTPVRAFIDESGCYASGDAGRGYAGRSAALAAAAGAG